VEDRAEAIESLAGDRIESCEAESGGESCNEAESRKEAGESVASADGRRLRHMLSRIPVTSRGERSAASPRRLAREDGDRTLSVSSVTMGPKPEATIWRPSEDDRIPFCSSFLLQTIPADSPDRR